MLVLNNCWTPYRSLLCQASDNVNKVFYLTEKESVRNFRVRKTSKERFISSVSIRNPLSPTQDLIFSGIPVDLIKCDSLLVFGWSYWQIIVVLFSRKILQKRTLVFFESTGSSRFNFLKRLFLSKKFLFLSPSLNSDKYLRQISNKYVVKRLPNYSIYRPSKEKVIPSERTVDILYVGRFAPEKNIPFLEKLYLERGSLNMLFVGDIFPFVEDSDQRPFIDNLMDVYLSAKFLVLPSLSEPYGMVAIEAWSCGCVPLVSSICGVASELGNDFVITSVQDVLRKVDNYEVLIELVTSSLDQFAIDQALKSMHLNAT